MKIIKCVLGVFLLTTLTSCGVKQYTRFASLTSVSNRNIDDSKKYILIKRDVTEICEAENDPLNVVMDAMMARYRGEFLRNIKIYINTEDKKKTSVKLIADVWGLFNGENLKVGDSVIIKKAGFLKDKILKAKVIGLSSNTIYVEDENGKKSEVRYDEVTKAQ